MMLLLSRRHIVCVVALLLLFLQSAHPLSSSQHNRPPRATTSSSLPPFLSFEFDPSTGICRNPASFRYTASSPSPRSNNNKNNNTETNDNTDAAQFFVLRNVPGDGDCIFHAVLSAVFITMGFMNPDADAAGSGTLMSSMALEMRRKYLVDMYMMYIRRALFRCRKCMSVTHYYMLINACSFVRNHRRSCQISIKS